MSSCPEAVDEGEKPDPDGRKAILSVSKELRAEDTCNNTKKSVFGLAGGHFFCTMYS